MKTKLKMGDAVPTGTVKEVATFADHVEYLVEQKDGTASWIHEAKLPNITKPETK